MANTKTKERKVLNKSDTLQSSGNKNLEERKISRVRLAEERKSPRSKLLSPV